jgi:hypothetical protein
MADENTILSPGEGKTFDWESLADAIDVENCRILGFSSAIEAINFGLRGEGDQSKIDLLKTVQFLAGEIKFHARNLCMQTASGFRRLEGGASGNS